jgi:SAM-dependent methyltransferase
MLAQAAKKLNNNVHLIHKDAASAAMHLRAQSQDLVLCHFLLSFVDASQLLGVAHGLLRPGGLLSFATSTQESLSEVHSLHFPRASRLLGVQRSLRKASTPLNHQQCLALLQAQGFEIVQQHLQRQTVCFASFDDVRHWALDSGWAASFLDDSMGVRKFMARFAFKLGELFIHPFYPIEATNEMSIVLARKPVSRQHP